MSLTDPVEETLHATTIRDSYRWLEDRNLPETDEWIRGQQRLCNTFFASFPQLTAIEARVREYLDVEVIDQPVCVRDRYFYRKRAAGEEQGGICMREFWGGTERILVTPPRGDLFTSLGIHRISVDGRLLAYEVKSGGEDRKEIRFVDVSTGALLSNSLYRGYARGLAFSQKGFFYCHETDDAAEEHRIYYQALDSACHDTSVFRVPRTRGSRLLLMANECHMGALWLRPQGPDVIADFWLAEIVEGTPAWGEVFREKRAPYNPILWRDRILALVETKTGGTELLELSQEGKQLRIFAPDKRTRIQEIALTRERIYLSYLEDGITTIDAWPLSGQHADSVNLPGGGTIRLLPSPAQETDRLFYSFESFDVPRSIYECCTATNASLLWHQQAPANRNGRRHVEQVTLPSLDGTQFSLTLVSTERDRAHPSPRPVIMTSYGGFGVTMTPQFSVLATILMELGAVLAVPHIRGGGEFGKAWHDAGRGKNRQASFDDFIVAAEWLCDKGVTTPHQLGIFGGSNSGLLVAVAMTQRPDLFGAVLSIAPLLDMVRYESFDEAVRWTREYGTVEDPEDFRALYAYSPYHNVADDIDYPSTLFVTGDKDDRCNPAHVRKMAALLQGRSSQTSPIIVDYSDKRGHSPVLPLSVRIPALARRIAFLCRELQIDAVKEGPNAATHS